MGTKRHKPEEIVAKLRQVDVLVSQGRSVADAIRSIGVTEVSTGRAAQRRDRLPIEGGADRDRELETSLQLSPAACLAGRQAAGPELFGPAFAAWPAALTRPAPPARLPIVQRPTVH
jgi:putative transposase